LQPLKAFVLLLLSTLILIPLFNGAASGITGNYTLDSTSYVGIVVLFSDTARQQPIGYCSGFLLSPTVMVTAGHALIGVSAVSVCFDKGPISYAIENGQIVYPTDLVIYNGTPVINPEYFNSLLTSKNHGNTAFSTSDIGIIVLDKPVQEVTTFPTLPSPGIVNTLPKKCDLKVIGYGLQVQETPKNNGVINSWIGTLSCNSANVNLISSNFAGSSRYIRCSANPSQDKGGIAFGDSGGPVLYCSGGQDVVIAVNAYVSNLNCAGVTYHTRLDESALLNWLNGFL